jgi:hypothetical protein
MLSVNILSVIMMTVIMLSVNILSVIMMTVIMLSVIMISINMPSIKMLNFVMFSRVVVLINVKNTSDQFHKLFTTVIYACSRKLYLPLNAHTCNVFKTR